MGLLPDAVIAQDDFVLVRRVAPSDLDQYFRWYKDPEIQEYMSNPHWDPEKPKSDFRDIFMRKYLIQTSDRLSMTICAIPGKRLVGQVMLFDINRNEKTAEVGILIGDFSDRRKGFASRTVKLVLGYASEEMGIRKFCCHIMKGNRASENLFTGIGFCRRAERDDLSELRRYEFVTDV